MIDPARVKETKEVLEKLREEGFEAAEALRLRGQGNVGDMLLLHIGYVTGALYKDMPEDLGEIDLIKGDET